MNQKKPGARSWKCRKCGAEKGEPCFDMTPRGKKIRPYRDLHYARRVRETKKKHNARAFRCPTCGAAAGEPCFTETATGDKIRQKESHYSRKSKARWEGV